MGIDRTYDPYFERYGNNVPVWFSRALAWHESRLNPKAQTGSYRGILQVGPSVLKDFNDRYKTNYSVDDTFDPEINIRIALDTINRIVAAYKSNHPDSLYPDWTDARWISLLVLGWNAGYSRTAGVQYAVKQMEQDGVKGEQVTVDSVHERAKYLTGASRHLKNEAKVRYAKNVANTAEKERTGKPGPFVLNSIAPARASIGGIGGVIFGILGAMGLGYLLKRKRA